MEYRKLGGTELNVSLVALGGNTFGPPRLDEAQSVRTIHAADDLGVNFIDTANLYGGGYSEAFIGTALADRRDRWVIATKFNLRNLGDANVADYITQACDNSLRKLNTDRIDLYQLHLPSLNTPEDEILRALDKLRQAGKVREIGASNHMSWHMAKNQYVARAMGVKPYVTAQDHYNLLRRHIEAELIPFANAYGVSIIPYFPLGGGFLSGKYKQGEAPPPGTRGAEGSGIVSRNLNDRNFEIVRKLDAFAAARQRSTAELALAWLLANPAVGSVITGVSSPEQVALNVKAAGWVLTPEEKSELDAIAPREGDDSGQPVGARAAAPAAA
ncbi:MAG: aldo/keto reductase [Phenylobacterium sp.]|uniref:aldo/keto reductase n=1 Tax=Phenylobacterium sp. TaxID=1871053 RepID=UPI0027356A0D|nr:aldo/keto reductase [Phenylobacterium sp.]MDP3174943.1 aldo/keto reductase [Phenylobacterium sp.]